MTNTRLLLTLAVLLVCNGVQAAITAPDAVEAGQLAVCKSDAPATWAIYPQEYRGSYYVADGGCTCVIASPVKGVITVMAASVNDAGGVDIAEHALYNGEHVPTPPAPEPEPEPEPAEPTIESIIEDTELDKTTAADYVNLSNCFATVIQSIDNGAIKTPAGARETFRAVWLRTAAKTNPLAIDTMAPLLTALSDKIDYTDLASIRRDFAAIVEALRAKGKTKSGSNSGGSGCANGQCSGGYYGRQ